MRRKPREMPRVVGERVELRDGQEFHVTVLAPKKGRVKTGASIKGATGVPKSEVLFNPDGTRTKTVRQRRSQRARKAAQAREEQRIRFIPPATQ